ncbi:MAG: hypothetical protein IPG89_01055 [Bacteroidetes bacterium]|nr:hypothetical protein [Bacteroidota bacterium]
MKFKKYINLKAIVVSAMALTLVAGFTSCEEVPNSPGFEFNPDMYRTRALRYYGEYVTATGDTLRMARKPVDGTIARGYLPAIPKGMTYEMADNLRNPLPFSPEVEKKKVKYCTENSVFTVMVMQEKVMVRLQQNFLVHRQLMMEH